MAATPPFFRPRGPKHRRAQRITSLCEDLVQLHFLSDEVAFDSESLRPMVDYSPGHCFRLSPQRRLVDRFQIALDERTGPLEHQVALELRRLASDLNRIAYRLDGLLNRRPCDVTIGVVNLYQSGQLVEPCVQVGRVRSVERYAQAHNQLSDSTGVEAVVATHRVPVQVPTQIENPDKHDPPASDEFAAQPEAIYRVALLADGRRPEIVFQSSRLQHCQDWVEEWNRIPDADNTEVGNAEVGKVETGKVETGTVHDYKVVILCACGRPVQPMRIGRRDQKTD